MYEIFDNTCDNEEILSFYCTHKNVLCKTGGGEIQMIGLLFFLQDMDYSFQLQ